MGFVALTLLVLAAAALLWRLGVARPLWSLGGAALMLGATGYALQGSPLLPGAAREPNAIPVEFPPELTELRDQMFGARYTADGPFLVAGDAMLRAGDAGAAVGWTLAGIRQNRTGVALWTQLGTTFAAHDGGQVSPPALFAFQQAMRLGPGQPGPPFFLGIAYVSARRFAEARPWWARALALSPPKAPYRSAIAERLALLDEYLRKTREAGG